MVHVAAPSLPAADSLESDFGVENLVVSFEPQLPRPIFPDNETRNMHARELAQLSKNRKSPQDWPESRKTAILWTTATAANLASFAASSYAPSKAKLATEWSISEVAALVGITTFTTGFGLAPMFLAPVSEAWGRKPVFIISGIIHVACQVACAATKSYPGMLISRFFAGVGSSTYSTLVGGVISDIYPQSERGTPMAIFSGSAIFGTGLGPLVCGFVVQFSSWRWTFWLQVILNALLLVAFAMFVPETRSNVLLRDRARELNKLYIEMERSPGIEFEIVGSGGVTSRRVRHVRWNLQEEHETSLAKRIAVSLYRPFQLLMTEPVVFFFSLWATFSWSVLYLALAAVPLVFREVYDFDLSSSNAIFATTCIGSIFASVVSVYQERWLDNRRGFGLSLDRPERRLYFSCIESILLAIGLFMFGWAANDGVPWVIPAIAIGISTVGIFSIYFAVFNYLADTYHSYASSALAAQSFCRNVVGGMLPLVTPQMFNGLGYGPAASLLGGIGLILTAVPWVLVIFGTRITERSRFASKLG